MPRCLFRLVFACLLSMPLVLDAVAAERVWIVLAEQGGPYAEAAETLKDGLEESAELSVAAGPVLFDKTGAPPDLIMAVGVGALDSTIEQLAKKGAGWARVPVLATLLPQAIFDARVATMGQRPFSAALLDQPLRRQMALIQRALPERRRVGIVPGTQTRVLLPALRQEASTHGLDLFVAPEVTAPEALYPALKTALEESDLILALPDPAVFSSASLQNILLTTYRARKPLVAFSAAYVKAGAVLAIYSTPAQVARRAVEMVRNWRAGRALPPPQAPREFSVAINTKVATSLGLQLDEAAVLAEALRRQEGER